MTLVSLPIQKFFVSEKYYWKCRKLKLLSWSGLERQNARIKFDQNLSRISRGKMCVKRYRPLNVHDRLYVFWCAFCKERTKTKERLSITTNCKEVLRVFWNVLFGECAPNSDQCLDQCLCNNTYSAFIVTKLLVFFKYRKYFLLYI